MALLTIPGRARDPARLGLLLILAVGCAAPSLSDPTTPGEVARPSREGRPIGRSDHPRAGKITYRLLAVRRSETEVRVDLELRNGTSQYFSTLLVRVLVYGPGGETRSSPVPLGGLRSGQARHFQARIPDLPFRVRDVGVELVYSAP